jgi:hypothetical protein
MKVSLKRASRAAENQTPEQTLKLSRAGFQINRSNDRGFSEQLIR